MGNCQAAEAATVVIQHPGGRVERLYCAATAADVMRANPGHYVALVTLRVSEDKPPAPAAVATAAAGRTVRLTRVKLLKPKDPLLLGHAYRLITSQEVTKALQARKEEKMKRAQQLLGSKQADRIDDDQPLDESLDQLVHHDRDGHRSAGAHSGARHRQWRPSLHSIAEVGS